MKEVFFARLREKSPIYKEYSEAEFAGVPMDEEEFVINSINLLLLDTAQKNPTAEMLQQGAIALNIMIDSLGIHDCCIIRVAPEHGYIPMLWYAGKDEKNEEQRSAEVN